MSTAPTFPLSGNMNDAGMGTTSSGNNRTQVLVKELLVGSSLNHLRSVSALEVETAYCGEIPSWFGTTTLDTKLFDHSKGNSNNTNDTVLTDNIRHLIQARRLDSAAGGLNMQDAALKEFSQSIRNASPRGNGVQQSCIPIAYFPPPPQSHRMNITTGSQQQPEDQDVLLRQLSLQLLLSHATNVASATDTRSFHMHSQPPTPSDLLRILQAQFRVPSKERPRPDPARELFVPRIIPSTVKNLPKPIISGAPKASPDLKQSISSPIKQMDSEFEEKNELTGRAPILLYQTTDDGALSEYQCFVRQQIEFFEADPKDVSSNAKGRNKPIVLGQVGIRCRHCASLPPKYRSRGAMYYPTKMNLIYQAAQNLVNIHLHNRCQNVPEAIHNDLTKLRKSKSSVGGGKTYWNESANTVGVYESPTCLRFAKPLSKSR